MLTIGLVLPLLLLGFYYLWLGRQTSSEQLDESIKQQAELAATAFEQWVRAQRLTLTTIAALSTQGDRQTTEEFLSSTLRTRQKWFEVQVIDVQGNAIISQSVREKPLPLVSIDMIRQEIERQKSLVILTEQLSDENLRLISLAMPLDNGSFIVARIDGSSASDIFRDLDLPEKHIIAVFGSNGRLLYRSNVSPEQMEVDVNNTSLLSAVTNQRSATTEIDSPYDGIRRLYGLAQAGTANATVAVGVPSSYLYEQASRRFTRHLFAGLIIATLAVIAAFLLARSITRPIQHLTETARNFGAGDLAVRAESSGGGVLNELGDTFNQMADQITRREQDLHEIDHLKSEFVNSVSHELRTPLTTIKTLVKVLQANKIDKREKAEYLATIAEECDRQIEFVQKLLDLSRIESGAHRPKFDTTVVDNLLDGVMESHVRAAASRGLELKHDDSPSVLVETDPNLLERIVSSLVENAMKYTTKGGMIALSAEQTPSHVLINVDDSGCGIAADDLPHVFERFYRGHSLEPAAVSGVSGTGLGLYLVHTMVAQLNGAISVVSPVPGATKGSRFTISLPANGLSGNTHSE